MSSSKEYVHTPRVGKWLVDNSNSGHTRGPKRCSCNLVLKQACSLALHVQRKCWQKLLVWVCLDFLSMKAKQIEGREWEEWGKTTKNNKKNKVRKTVLFQVLPRQEISMQAEHTQLKSWDMLLVPQYKYNRTAQEMVCKLAGCFTRHCKTS